ncbi:T9SS type A sorting domain-containing protein [Segetibacter sp. 3557_3]|uniref:Kelch repeat-containing protein n=1 Tax=Segetibacter sp. 3557_3 TaxID=2547429 RepID=UPI00105906C4|nr:kelch repeat-containing protein [Segetibacter sp. 3557_3]TDH18181.1 T9SS type A sorting domain-containing protein [Segetibacter sp. 3557_3]
MKVISKLINASLCLFLVFSSNAQITTSSQWTWMKGENVLNSPGVYGTKGIAAPANTPGARSQGMSWTDAAGNFWLFGGVDDLGNPPFDKSFNDLWKYSIITNRWTWISGDNVTKQPGVYGTAGTAAAGNKPGARFGSSTWTDVAGNLWLFGGQGHSSSGFGTLNDLWKYTPVTNEWTWVNGSNSAFAQGVYGIRGIPAAANRPGARQGSVTWTDLSGNFWLFGGISNSYFNDLWKYNPVTNEWTWINGANTVNQEGVYGTLGVAAPGNRPGARGYSATWTDALGNFWFYGGYGYSSFNYYAKNDLWKYDPLTNLWTWVNGGTGHNEQGVYGTQGIAAPTNRVGARLRSVAWSDDYGNFWLFGGFSSSSYESDLWRYNLATNLWTWMNDVISTFGTYGTPGVASGNVPGARSSASSWKDASGNLWLFGGRGYAATASIGTLNDLWRLNSLGVLPITFSSLKGYQEGNHIAVQWTVENETGIKQYEIEKSSDGIMFSKAAVEMAKNNTSGTATYAWVDVNTSLGNRYYRVRSTGTGGEVKYSQVVKVALSNVRRGYAVYPNSVTGSTLVLQFINQPKGSYEVQMLNAYGQLIQATKITHPTGSSTHIIKFRSNISKGNYTLKVIAPDNSRQSFRIMY